MKISKKSWHYRWFAKNWDTLPKGLCWYFWKVIGSIIRAIAYGVIACAMVICGTIVVTYPVWQFFIDAGDTIEVASLSFVVWGAFGAFVLYEYREHLIYTGDVPRREPKPPGLLSSYLHAKHRKVCPLLEYDR